MKLLYTVAYMMTRRPAQWDARETDGNGASEMEPDAIRMQLNRILASPLFRQSKRLERFLSFTVERSLAGDGEGLKEYVVGVEVYDRPPDFQPSQDSIVRTEARRLRGKLKQYYEGEGSRDPIFIEYSAGSYAPAFRHNGIIPAPKPLPGGDAFVDQPGITLAVLPFVDLSGTPLSSACALGVADELVHGLMRTEGIRVMTASSMDQLAKQAADIPALAEKLALQLVFEGTVQQDGKTLRVSARIVDREGVRLWSQRFESEVADGAIFEVQSRIVTALLTRLAPQQSLVRKQEASPSPLLFTLLPLLYASEALLEDDPDCDVAKALAGLRRVASALPNFARPWWRIADCHVRMVLQGAPSSHGLVAEAKTAALRALQLDPEMVQAHSMLASVTALDWKPEEADALFRRALTLGDHHNVYRQYAMFLSSRGRFDEALGMCERAEQSDAFSLRHRTMKMHLFYISRRFAPAVAYFERRFSQGPAPSEVLSLYALSLVALGREGEAAPVAQELRARVAARPFHTCLAMEAVALSGDPGRSAAESERSGLLEDAAPLSNFRKASLCAAIGRQEDAFRFLKAAAALREAEMVWAAVDPRFDVLREDKRFPAHP